MKHYASLAAFTTALLLSTSVIASPPPASSAARSAFAEGQHLFDSGELVKAAALFRHLYEETRSPNAHFMLARTLIRLDRLPEAHEEMAGALREATDAAQNDPTRYETTRDAAAAQIALLERKVGKLIVVLMPLDASAKVTVGGVALPAGKLGVPIAVAPGEVTIEETLPGRSPVRVQIRIDAGETKTIPLTTERPALRPEPARPGPLPPAPISASASRVRVAGFVVSGAGVVALLVGGGTGLGALSKFARLEKECGGARCVGPEYAGVVDDGKRLQTITNVALTVGAAITATGILMIAFGGASVSSATPGSPRVSAGIAPTQGGAALWLTITR